MRYDVALISAPMGLQIMWYCMMEQDKSVNAVWALGPPQLKNHQNSMIFSKYLTSLPHLQPNCRAMILKDQQSIIQN